MNDGGPAFPVVFEDSRSYYGMSLRDYFAAAWLQGWLASDPPDLDHKTVARAAYVMADVMLAEREKSK